MSLRYDADAKMPEDAKLKVPELLAKYGYPCEIHYAITRDNYILQMHRIPFGKELSNNRTKKPFLLLHGIFSSSADWIITGPEKGFGYVLADNGYDVWLANFRGNTYSRSHTFLDPDVDAKEFWDFSWHELGVYDLPSMIDYILETTNENSLLCAGHSQGTTAFYVMASEMPSYNAKIKVQFSLSPIAYMCHMTSPFIRSLALADDGMDVITNKIGLHELLPNSDSIVKFSAKFCGDGITQILCKNVIFATFGFSPKQMNASLIPIIMGHTPAGSSTKQFLHYMQEIKSCHFRQYDYDSIIRNVYAYNEMTPPDYDLSKITAKVYLIYSKTDFLSNDIDVEKLYVDLPNAEKFLITDQFSHVDYLYGIYANELVYKHIITWANTYN